MRAITVTCHSEAGVWWAEAGALPGLYATAPSLEELRTEVRGGVDFALEDEPVSLRFVDESGASLDSFSVR